MNRRQLLATASCLLGPSVSGCLTDPGTDGGLLEVLLTTAPSGATVTDASDDRVRTVDPLQDGLEQAATARTSVAEIEVTESEYDIVARTLSKLPWYERSGGSRSPSGIYFRYEGRVYVAVLTPFCTESILVDAESDRGEYGRGGCHDRAEWGYESDTSSHDIGASLLSLFDPTKKLVETDYRSASKSSSA